MRGKPAVDGVLEATAQAIGLCDRARWRKGVRAIGEEMKSVCRCVRLIFPPELRIGDQASTCFPPGAHRRLA